MTTPRKTTAKKATAKSTSTRTIAKKTASTKKAPAAKTTKPQRRSQQAPRARGRVGSNERATFDELVVLQLVDTAAGRAALEMARWVDKATTAQAAAAAGRELRMQMAAARNVGKPLSPPADADEDDDDDEGGGQPAPGVRSLAAMRARADARRSG